MGICLVLAFKLKRQVLYNRLRVGQLSQAT